jgi:integrase
VDEVNRKRREEARKITEATGIEMEPSLLSKWTPNQLRHTAGTEIRRVGGLEAAQVVLGHAKADVTQIYAERDVNLAMDVMRKIG